MNSVQLKWVIEARAKKSTGKKKKKKKTEENQWISLSVDIIPSAMLPALVIGLLLLIASGNGAHVGAHVATEGNVPITFVPLSTGAACLDGSPYGFYYVGNSPDASKWTISIEGGGASCS